MSIQRVYFKTCVGVSAMFNYKILKSGCYNFFVVWAYFILFMNLIVYQAGNFLFLIIPKSNWDIIDAKIDKIVEVYSIGKESGSSDNIGEMKMAQISCNYNDKDYFALVPFSFDEKEGDDIQVAINKKWSNLCVRKEIIKYSKIKRYIIKISFLIILVDIINTRRKNKKNKKNSIITISSN